MKRDNNEISNSSNMHPKLFAAWQRCEETRKELLVTLHKVKSSDW